MISLSRGPAPNVLTQHEEEWTREFVRRVCSKQKPYPNKYRHPDIKVFLRASTNGKCMWCESDVDHISYGDIEHYYPKMQFPDNVVKWDNLGYSCSKCNNNKSDTWIDEENKRIVNPYHDDPNQHFVFVGGFVFGKTSRGSATEQLLKLNRAELVDRRNRRIKDLQRLILKWRDETNPRLKQLIEDEIQEEISSETEYSAVAEASYQLLSA